MLLVKHAENMFVIEYNAGILKQGGCRSKNISNSAFDCLNFSNLATSSLPYQCWDFSKNMELLLQFLYYITTL